MNPDDRRTRFLHRDGSGRLARKNAPLVVCQAGRLRTRDRKTSGDQHAGSFQGIDIGTEGDAFEPYGLRHGACCSAVDINHQAGAVGGGRARCSLYGGDSDPLRQGGRS